MQVQAAIRVQGSRVRICSRKAYLVSAPASSWLLVVLMTACLYDSVEILIHPNVSLTLQIGHCLSYVVIGVP